MFYLPVVRRFGRAFSTFYFSIKASPGQWDLYQLLNMIHPGGTLEWCLVQTWQVDHVKTIFQINRPGRQCDNMSHVVSCWLGMHLVLKNKPLYAGVYATHWVQTWRNSLLSFFVFTCTTALKSRSVSFQSTPSPRTSIIPIIPPRKSPAKKHGVLKFLPKLLAMDCPVVIFVHKDLLSMPYCPCFRPRLLSLLRRGLGIFPSPSWSHCSFASSLWLFSSLSKHNEILFTNPLHDWCGFWKISKNYEKYWKITFVKKHCPDKRPKSSSKNEHEWANAGKYGDASIQSYLQQPRNRGDRKCSLVNECGHCHSQLGTTHFQVQWQKALNQANTESHTHQITQNKHNGNCTITKIV